MRLEGPDVLALIFCIIIGVILTRTGFITSFPQYMLGVAIGYPLTKLLLKLLGD